MFCSPSKRSTLLEIDFISDASWGLINLIRNNSNFSSCEGALTIVWLSSSNKSKTLDSCLAVINSFECFTNVFSLSLIAKKVSSSGRYLK